MGAWGTGVFENDGALDLLAVLRDADPEERSGVLREALEAAADESDYLENPEAQSALAAAAVVAAARGGEVVRNGAEVPEPDTALIALAGRALDRIVAEESEWRELWEEADELEEAFAELAEVRTGLDLD
ncbi:DUF4259 domain-containing protein [Actinosynnema pretiosum subsp. pretiosum]|uniref:DUF4259 domain-containing protein n=2 Tax=Actinosynnema TaxID=40566 RepID=C6WBH7_ACTMD|nr:DUF4259 domain-containing protein [Actinosynnema mirum]ACU35545.1 conserved hypothetical protein [Actinosynnema mirum DSM 43827]QUF06783.1 DUF4259 domain-containing protein [Actinosynnema pretiosum subsp. pretiosum]